MNEAPGRVVGGNFLAGGGALAGTLGVGLSVDDLANKVVDAGQWNNSYSLELIALKLFFGERIHRV